MSLRINKHNRDCKRNWGHKGVCTTSWEEAERLDTIDNEKYDEGRKEQPIAAHQDIIRCDTCFCLLLNLDKDDHDIWHRSIE